MSELSLEELQKKKLQLEIADLARPTGKRISSWVSVATAVIAIGGVFGQNIISNIAKERAALQVEQAEKQKRDYEAQVEVLKKSYSARQADLTALQEANRREEQRNINILSQSVLLRRLVASSSLSGESQRTAAQTENAAYWVGIIGYNVKPQNIDNVYTLLLHEGYTIGFTS
jgi:hypothetical protein